MVRWRRVSGKADGELDMLIVRAYNYADERVQGILDKVTEIWHHLVIPPNTKLVSIGLPHKVRYYPQMGSGYPFWLKFWAALLEFKAHPAQWLVVVDADVLPTRKEALNELYAYLKRLNGKAQIVTRNPITPAVEDREELYQWWVYLLRCAINGVSAAPSSGIIAFHFTFVPYFALQILPYLLTPCDELCWSTTGFFPNVAPMPVTLCQIFHTQGMPTLNDKSPAFMHPAGGGLVLSAYARAVKESWERVMKE